MPPAVTLSAIRKSFADASGAPRAAIAPLTLSIEEGEFVALIGPSGCGKSTLLRIVAGLDRADVGSVHVAARDAATSTPELAYVFQDAHLLPWRTVSANVALPLELRGVAHAEIQARTRAALHDVDLDDALDRYPAQLSGGMRMRVSIARALVTRPRLLLMDEPFAALDDLTRQRLDERLRDLQRSQRFTTLFVTHGIFEAAFLATRAIVLSKRPARIVHDAAIDLPDERPRSVRATPEFAREVGVLMRALEDGSEDREASPTRSARR